ncbi:MAG: tetratricopeptide repeat protein, partial [Pseudomonadales bacterium]|nr:tetratricopeptide repeat protein [Pseudomonadales bacterium]
MLFSNADYNASAAAYRAIVRRHLRDESQPDHQPSSFLINAYYMLGWAEFKLELHDEALRSFVVVLDEYTQKAIAGYGTRSSDELLQDTFRVMALSFSYTNGAQTIASLLDEIDERPYSDRLFAELGDLYLKKKRYRDSAAVFNSFVERYPQSDKAPEFHQRQIDAFAAGRFPQEVREQKRRFAANYAVDGEFWQSAAEETQVFIKSKLTVYLAELASYHHNLAQQSKAKWQSKGSLATGLAAVQQHFRDASGWYKEWIRSFPGAADLPEKYFLLGETHYEASDYEPAIAAYEMAAYGFNYGNYYTLPANYAATAQSSSAPMESDLASTAQGTDDGPLNTQCGTTEDLGCATNASTFNRANEAGYAALLAYDYLIAAAPDYVAPGNVAPENTLQDVAPAITTAAGGDLVEQQPVLVAGPPDKRVWRNKKIESALLFAENFLLDSRRHKVLAQTINSLLELQQYQRTVDVAVLLTSGSDAGEVSRDLLFSAWLASAHAQMALEAFPAAESAYQQALFALGNDPLQPLHQQHYQQTLENYAASIYRQGELAHAAGEPLLAANTFLRVVEAAPGSTIRMTAQHDASVLLMQVEQWQLAIDVISDFQQRFPNHAEAQAAPARLLEANQKLQNWGAAAVQALAMADRDADAEVRRQALYSAAELFEKDQDIARAMASYERYANSYSRPLAELMEAQYKLVGFYEQRRDTVSRRMWLARLEAAHISAAQKTDRSRYLAALASSELSGQQLQAYHGVKLNIPLKASLARKRQAMQVALAAYEKTASYGVAEYTTMASQRMGEIYASFATALMNSERPKNLSELELEQYEFLLEEQAY